MNLNAQTMNYRFNYLKFKKKMQTNEFLVEVNHNEHHEDGQDKEGILGIDLTNSHFTSELNEEDHNILEQQQDSKKRKLSNHDDDIIPATPLSNHIKTDETHHHSNEQPLDQKEEHSEDDEYHKRKQKILPPCQICSSSESKYTCPCCSIKYCSMECFKNHKTTSSCTGKRDTTKYIDLKEFNGQHLRSDYNFLENLQSQTIHWSRQRDLEKIDSHTYQYHHPKVRELQYRATQKGIRMELMPQGMSKREQNSSYYNKKLDKIFWRLEFIFMNELDHQTGEPCHWVEAHVSEDLKICDLMSRYFDKNVNGSAKTRDHLQKYTSYFEKFKQSLSSTTSQESTTVESATSELENFKEEKEEHHDETLNHVGDHSEQSSNLYHLEKDHALQNQHREDNGVSISSPLRDAFFYFIKVEGRSSSETLYYALDSTLCLRECLKNLVILEYPVIEVVLPGYESKYTVITREQMNDMNAQRDERLKEKKEKRQAFLEKKTKYEERQAEKLESFRGQGNKRGGGNQGRGRGGHSGEKRSHAEISHSRSDNHSHIRTNNNNYRSSNRTDGRRGGSRGGKSKNYHQPRSGNGNHQQSQDSKTTQSSGVAENNNNH